MDAHQKELQRIQRSSEGFHVASYLLQTASRNCQYFGALTYAVVIQNSELSEENVQALLTAILGHIRQLSSDETQILSNLFVLRKLMSDLCVLLIKLKLSHNPVGEFLRSIANADIPDLQSYASLVPQLSRTLLGLLLIFFAILAEDIVKLNDGNSATNSKVKSDIFPYLEVTYEYLAFLQEKEQLPLDLDIQALETLSSWMAYIPNATGDSRYDSEQLTLIVKFLLRHFTLPINHEDDQVMSSLKLCLSIFNEILEINAPLLSVEQKLSLYLVLFNPGEWGEQFLGQIVFHERREEFHEEVNAFVDLSLTVLQLNAIRLSKSLLEPSTQNILSIALRLTSIEGVALSDEFISEHMLGFWEEFANIYQDSSDMFDILFEESKDAQFKDRFESEKKSLFINVSKIYWSKIHIPDLSTYNGIRNEFLAYRNTVAEFFNGAYALLKSEYYEMLCDSLISSIQKYPQDPGLLADIEATFYLLYKINSDTIYFESQEKAIAPFSQRIFSNNIFDTFRNISLSDERGQIFYSTFVQYLASNEFFLKTPEGSLYLGQVFDMLFPIIMAGNSKISLLALKTATKICEECSLSLTGFLPNLESVVIEMLRNPIIDSLIRLRMFNAYSVIARSIKDLKEHATIVKGLVSAVGDAALAMMDAAGGNLSETQEDYLVSLISCLVNIGKGSALSDEETDEFLAQQEVDYREFWQEDPLGIRTEVLSIVKRFSLEYTPLTQKTIVVEKCIQVFKSGLGEKLGGPFAFEDLVIAQYLVELMDQLRNPNAVPQVFSLFESLISANASSLSIDLVSGLVDRLFTLRLDFLKTDPDMIKAAIDVFAKIVETKPSLIVHAPVFSGAVVGFALEGFGANESFIVKSILKFWVNIINMKRGTMEDQQLISALFVEQQLGKMLTYELMSSFIKSTRSHLEYYYTVFRCLAGKYPVQFKQWLNESLDEQKSTLLAKVEPKDITMFSHKLLITRGRRTANDVLKLFWLQANGLVEYNSQSY